VTYEDYRQLCESRGVGPLDHEEAVVGDVVDVSHPEIGPEATTSDVLAAARELVASLPDGHAYAMVQGEPTFVTAVVALLQARGIIPVASTTERVSDEQTQPDGSVRVVKVFRFRGWREYPQIALAVQF